MIEGITEIVAAAIREDRAEPVSEAEIKEAAIALCQRDTEVIHEGKRLRSGKPHWESWIEEARVALEAARKTRINAKARPQPRHPMWRMPFNHGGE